MKLISLPNEKKIRLWADADPVSLYNFYYGNKIKYVLPKHGAALKIIALEAMVPFGARFLYGMLGARLIQGDDSGGCVAFSEGDQVEIEVNNSLAKGIDNVWSGLPFEYAAAVEIRAQSVFNETGFKPHEKIDFFCSSFGEISSSISIFNKLSEAVTFMLLSKNISSEDIDLRLESIFQFDE
jgi:hypothetical protein